ncbi:MAG: hypothetical protein AAF098_11930 [Pseudomonadota bacterium]
MKHAFKPLGIAAAVAAASASYVNVANAQPSVANNALGDLALVPYYTVNGEWITGIHIVNTSDATQVVKFRFRRAEDSLDALDFNVVMSPQDVYAGFLSDDADGNINWSADDTTCTVPATSNGVLTMPPIYREGAETGYVEIIAMGEADDDEPISIAAKHGSTSLTPLDCDAVRSNFFQAAVDIDNDQTIQDDTDLDLDEDDDTDELLNDYTDSGNVLKVSYFHRDNATGIEFGDNAVHIQDFLTRPAITNQQFGYLSGDLNGFDFPDLDGGSPTGAMPERNRFELLRASDVLGVGVLINEWTANAANGAALDWVVTMPGQYTMLNLPIYITALADALDGEDSDDFVCAGTSESDAVEPTALNLADDDENIYFCDFRDIPVTASISPYNREELAPTSPDGQLVVSPQIPELVSALRLEKETNVITFGGNSVLGVSDVDITADLDQPFGWLTLGVSSWTGTTQSVCEWPNFNASVSSLIALISCSSVTGAVPMIGYAAWARQVAANPDASYGRIVAHSFTS